MIDVTGTAPAAQPDPTLQLSELLRRTVVDAAGQSLGRLHDVIVRLPAEDHYPAVTGLVARIGGRELFVPASQILAWNTDRLELATPRLDLRRFERHSGEVQLSRNVLGHRLVDLDKARLVTACDIRLTHHGDNWIVTAVDIHPTGLLHRSRTPVWRDWTDFEAMIGQPGTAAAPRRLGRLRGLKPADLANIIEAASDEEQADLLTRVRENPDLEADVFEELDEDEAGDLLETRPDEEIAGILGRMRADDADDALLDLPHDRRRAVLDLLPDSQKGKVTVLLGYQEATAGGLMGLEYISVPLTSTVADAIRTVAEAAALQPEALVTVYCHDDRGRIVGAVSLVALVQADPTEIIQIIADLQPVHVHPEADLNEITLAMADYNLLVLPVLDNDDHLLGVLTVDDVLEAAIPNEWRHMQT